MKIVLALMLCAVVAAAPQQKEESVSLPDPDMIVVIPPKFPSYPEPKPPTQPEPQPPQLTAEELVAELIDYVRRVIARGSSDNSIPPLDPLRLDEYHLLLPAGLINLDLELKNIFATGFGDFVVHSTDLNLNELSFDIDVSIPSLDISTEYYDLLGNLFSAIPLYGKGNAEFKVDGYRFQAKLWLKQSANNKAVVIDRITNVAFKIPVLKSAITGAIGGGDIDAIVNRMAEEVFLGYVNRFQGAIGLAASRVVLVELNPFLEELDTWRYVAPLIPRED